MTVDDESQALLWNYKAIALIRTSARAQGWRQWRVMVPAGGAGSMPALLGPTIGIFAKQQHPQLNDQKGGPTLVGVDNVVSKSKQPFLC